MTLVALGTYSVLSLAVKAFDRLHVETRTTQSLSLLFSGSVVKLTHMQGGGGTGFGVETKSGQKLILTNWHVCHNPDSVMIVQQREFILGIAKVIKEDPLHDLCLLRGPVIPAVPLGEAPKLYQTIYVAGHPLMRRLTPSQGMVVDLAVETPLSFEAESDGNCLKGFVPKSVFDIMTGTPKNLCVLNMHLVDTTAQILPGNSGSPVVDSDGLLVGVMNSVFTTGEGSMIPFADVERFLNEN